MHTHIVTHTLTPGDHALKPDDVGVQELAHDRRLSQEVPPLLLRVPALQGFYCHGNVRLPCRLQLPTAHLPEFTCETHAHTQNHTQTGRLHGSTVTSCPT